MKILAGDASLTPRSEGYPSVALDPRCAQIGRKLLKHVLKTGERGEVSGKFFQASIFIIQLAAIEPISHSSAHKDQARLSESQRLIVKELDVLNGLNSRILSRKY